MHPQDYPVPVDGEPDPWRLYGRAVELLDRVAAEAQLPPQLAAEVKLFLSGAAWHDAMKSFLDGE